MSFKSTESSVLFFYSSVIIKIQIKEKGDFMNYMVIVSFIVVVLSSLVFAFPWPLILRFGLSEEYCKDCAPKRSVRIVRFFAVILLLASLAVFFIEITPVEFDWEFYKSIDYFS